MGRYLTVWVVAAIGAAVLAGCVGTSDEDQFVRHAAAGLPAMQRAAGESDAAALPQLSESSTLDDYLTYAAMNNPAVQAAYRRWQASVARIPQAGALPDPQLNWRYFLGNRKMGAGPDMALRQSIGISQMIPWPGKLILGAEMAGLEAQGQFSQFEAERLKLFYEVKVAYYEYYYLGRAIAIAEENARLMEFLENVARTRYQAAAASHPDVIRAQVELGKLRNELSSMTDMKSPLAARLNAALNRPLDAPLPLPATIETSQAALEEAWLLGELERANPQLQASESELAASSAGVDIAKQSYLPDLMVGLEWMDMTAVSGATMGAKDNWALMTGISLPIWWTKNAAMVREARARHQAAALDKTAMSNMLQADLKMAAFGYRDAARRVVLYHDNLLPKAGESLKATQAAYKAGGVTFSDLVDSQRVMLEFQLAYERALVDSQQRLAEVEMLVGKNISPRPKLQDRPAP